MESSLMTCRQCGAELIPGKRFCPTCGTAAALQCHACGSEVDPTSRYCPNCGATIVSTHSLNKETGANYRETAGQVSTSGSPVDTRSTAAATVGERKLVTVLFCDLVGSTAIAEQLDPEEYHDLLERYLELVMRKIHRLGGLVNQLAGDGVMALFGAPVAYEDAPERAVRAALAVRGALDDLNRRSHARTSPELRVRIGIHTGPVMVGTVGNDLKMDYTATGDTTNLASRLQSLAEPGMILVSEPTERLVRGVFKLGHANQFAVRGKAEKVTAYEVLDLSEATTPIEIAAAQGLTPLVGRGAELSQLNACYQRLADNIAQVVTVVGEAGSGKSRLLYEFKKQLADKSVVFFEERSSSLSRNLPYAAIIRMLSQYFGLRPNDAAESTCNKVSRKLQDLGETAERLQPLLCRLLSVPAEETANLPVEELRRETFEAVARLVTGVSEQSPVIVILEDLHWMDDSSRELLELAVARISGARVMFLITHRPDYQPWWRTDAWFTQLNLRPLSESDATEMIHSLAGGSLPAKLSQLILAKAEGNPFFTEEMTRALFEKGDLVRDRGKIKLTRPVEDVRIPDTVQELIAARLDRLRDSTKRVVQVASVLGRQFRREHLVDLLAEEKIDVTRELEELQRRGVIHSNQLLSRDEFRFGESLTLEVAYEGLLIKERRRLHERVGLLLEQALDQPTPEQSALLAHHFGRSDNQEKALQASLRAAADAEKAPSFRAAAAHYQEAWELAEKRLAKGEKTSQRFLRWALEAAYGVCRMPVLYSADNLAEARRAADRGRELAKELGDTETLAHLCSLQGMLTMMAGEGNQFKEGLALVEEGHALAQQAGLALAAISISRGLAWNYLLDGQLALAARTIGWTVSELERQGHREQLSDLYLGARWLRDSLHSNSDNLKEAAEGAAETYEMALRAPNRTCQSSAAGTLAQVHFLWGDYSEAQQWADRGLEVAQAISLAAATRTTAAVALMARIKLGEKAATSRYIGILEQALAAGGVLAPNCYLVVKAFISAGELKRAERAAQIFSRAGGQFREMLSATARGDVMLKLGPAQWDHAQQCYDKAIALARTLGVRTALAAAVLGAGELAAARGDHKRSAHHLREVIAVSKTLGLRHYLTWAQKLLGAVMQ